MLKEVPIHHQEPATAEHDGWSTGWTDHGCTPIPRGIATLEPGPLLAAMLATVDIAEASAYDQFLIVMANQRMASSYDAAVLDGMAAIVDRTVGDQRGTPLEASAVTNATSEIGAMLHLTRRAAERSVAVALALRHRVPRVRDLLCMGDIDRPRANTIVEATSHLNGREARRVVEEIADSAPESTPGELRARIRETCISMNPDAAARRYESSVSRRRVITQASDDGTAHLYCMDLPPDRVGEVTRRINTIARSLRRADESRTMDQLRADIVLDLLAGNDEHRIGKGSIDIRVDLETLAELNDNPGYLAGYGPVIADIARQSAVRQTDLEHRFVVTDLNGVYISAGVTKARPDMSSPDAEKTGFLDGKGRGRNRASSRRRRFLTASERRIVEMLRPTCAFPGCRMPAADSDIDHIVDFVRLGPTCIQNSAPLCRHHNNVKKAGWTYRIVRCADPSPDPVRRATAGAIRYEWTTPSGHTLTTGADP